MEPHDLDWGRGIFQGERMSDVLSRTAAASELHTTPRMLRYREALGVLPPTERQYGSAELAAAEYAVELEQLYDISPKTLAFALRAVLDDDVRADVLRLGELTGRLLDREDRL
jgi:hypothetical protein